MILVVSVLPLNVRGQMNLVGSEFSPIGLSPVLVNSSTGTTQTLINGPASADQFIAGNSTIDVQNGIYYYVRAMNQLVKVNLTTGAVGVQFLADPLGTTSPANGVQFNSSDGMIYGLSQLGNQLWLTKTDPNVGLIQIVNSTPTSATGYQAGDATLDSINGKYYYIRGTGSHQLISVDIATGVAQTIPLAFTTGVIHPAVNLQYNYNDGFLYGLRFTSGSLSLVKIHPNSGAITSIGGVLSSDGFSSGNATFDQEENHLVYVRGFGAVKEVISVDVTTGIIAERHFVQQQETNGMLTNIEYIDGRVFQSAKWSYRPTCAPFEILFQSQSIADSVVWDFGDGSMSSATQPLHTYANAGTFLVSLTSFSSGNMLTTTQNISVNTPVTVNLGNDTVLNYGDTLLLSAYTVNAVQYVWSNGASGTSIAVTQSGVYGVEVTTTDQCVYTDTIQIFPVASLRIGLGSTQYSGDISVDEIEMVAEIENLNFEDRNFVVVQENNVPSAWNIQTGCTGQLHVVSDSNLYIEPNGLAQYHLFVTFNGQVGQGTYTLHLYDSTTGEHLRAVVFQIEVEQTVSVKSLEKKNNASSVFASGVLLRVGTDISTGLLYDLTGKMVQNLKMGHVFTLPRGLYFVLLETGEVHKIVSR